MMMPANFTAVNSEVVYGGADLLSVLADTTAPIWNASNVKTFNTNVIKLISNSFFAATVNSTLGVMFSGNWGEDNKIFGDEGSLKKNIFTTYKEDSNGNPVVDVDDGVKMFGDDGKLKNALYGDDDMGFGNKVMRTLGMASVLYTLGTTDAKVGFNDKVMGAFGETY